MARPRVFISSTFYDLKQVRADLVRFVKDMGYEAVDNNRGNIPYGSQEKLEEYCYKEIELVDILIAIVGGRYGSNSQHGPYSVSQMEIKTALGRGKQVYIFVDSSVLSEYSTYTHNKSVDGIRYRFVDNRKVYEFLEEIYSFPNNNPIAPFQTSEDITDYLREQWAGLLQRFLQEQVHQKEFRVLDDMQKTAQTLNQLVTFLTEERRSSSAVIQDILLSNHPIFSRLAKLLTLTFRIFFVNAQELADLLTSIGYSLIPIELWDDAQVAEWYKEDSANVYNLGIKNNIFDITGKLKMVTTDEFDSDCIKLIVHVKKVKHPFPTKSHIPLGQTKLPPTPAYPEDDFDDTDPFADRYWDFVRCFPMEL